MAAKKKLSKVLTKEQLKVIRTKIKEKKKKGAQQERALYDKIYKISAQTRKEVKALDKQIDDHYDAQWDAKNAKRKAKEKKRRAKIIAEKKKFNASKDSFIMYKKATVKDGPLRGNPCIVKLQVPAKALRIASTEENNEKDLKKFKIRVSEAKVLGIYGYDTRRTNALKDIGVTEAVGYHKTHFIYKKDTVVKPERAFDENVKTQCSSGIHGYLSIIAAKKH